ncbi:GNAT family N-acetyltransferase [Palleronia pelagia]|uniref:Ribosomal-protein-alanine N-acetyltransferase n=1 Tax=Palleronia pelagia TaxID=387096 RepID=A0A1H8AXW5_9RHOB|nr:GNAT family N-acetyltransferase [Palleronia pelagia]SEM74744.1 ribosomal-protein-alanine N-acetyltransferase [Palleronia pelagia]
MTPEDLARLHARAITVPPPFPAEGFRDLLAQPGAVLVTRDHAFALGRVVLDEAELLTIATDPDHRRKGLGRACLDAFHDDVRAYGATRVFLEVAETNAAARALYDAMGYEQLGLRRGYYRDPAAGSVDALVLGRDLVP